MRRKNYFSRIDGRGALRRIHDPRGLDREEHLMRGEMLERFADFTLTLTHREALPRALNQALRLRLVQPCDEGSIKSFRSDEIQKVDVFHKLSHDNYFARVAHEVQELFSRLVSIVTWRVILSGKERFRDDGGGSQSRSADRRDPRPPRLRR